jgi:hypothetical protein
MSPRSNVAAVEREKRTAWADVDRRRADVESLAWLTGPKHPDGGLDRAGVGLAQASRGPCLCHRRRILPVLS